jgi:hypothetical protein
VHEECENRWVVSQAIPIPKTINSNANLFMFKFYSIGQPPMDLKSIISDLINRMHSITPQIKIQLLSIKQARRITAIGGISAKRWLILNRICFILTKVY